MKWEKGRQGTGYEKLKLFQFLNIDCYLLRYNKGDSIPWHSDPVPGRKHWRLNILLRRAVRGGLFFTKVANSAYCKQSRITLFRSDLTEHCVTKVKAGSRWVLTFGVAL